MFRFNQFFMRACMYSCIFFAVTSCKDTDDFFSKNEKTAEKEANSFDFSTIRAVDLIVDYSAFETCGPVRFSIYDTNPIVGENTESEHMDESIKPIFEAYTDVRGKFDATVTLPAYAKVLHIVTGNLAVGFSHKPVEVVNNEAKITVENDGTTMDVYNPRRATWTGEPTNVLGNLVTDCKVNSSGKATSTKIYKTWATPLGHWNSASGHPVDYLLDKTTVTTPGLVLSDKEVDDMYAEACNILPNNTGINNSHYRTSADVTLKEESEVTITALGSFTCWNSSLAYYYYNESNKPTNRMDLNPIMLFPNTQDGKRYTTTSTENFENTYKGNIGMVRGDVIQLMYYPNIANGDYSGATTKFPKGTKIGFLMRTNGWGMMGSDYCTKTYSSAQNIWVSSTEGMSYAEPFSGNFKVPNPTGEARTAMFSYTAKDNSKYCILAFEDACDDNDYNDLIFSLNPASVFLGLNEVEKDKTTQHGVYAFEDRWPGRGDYDMNDVMIDYNHELEFNSGKIIKETFKLTTYQNYVADISGLAVRLDTKAALKSLVMKKIEPGKQDAKQVTFTKDDQENIYYLTDNVTRDLYTSYIFELTYTSAQEVNDLATVEPFLYRDDPENGRWEVHLPGIQPTNKMNMSYFGTNDDASDPDANRWYVRKGLYPFAFYMANASIDLFFDTILLRKNENTPISDFYPEFLTWVFSNGKKCEDWYLHPKK